MCCFISSGGFRVAFWCPLHPHSFPAQYLLSLMPKQLAHSSSAMYLSLSRSQASKKRVVQCSMGMRGARRGASSVWDRYLPRRPHGQCAVCQHQTPFHGRGDSLLGAGASTQQDAGPSSPSGLTVVPLPSQYLPLSVMKVKDCCLLLQPAVLVTK